MADTAKPVVEPSPVYALTTGLSLKVFWPSTNSLIVITSPFTGAVPKVKVVDDTVKSVVGRWKTPFRNTNMFSTVAPLVTVTTIDGGTF